MKNEIINIEDLSDSKELMMQKSPPIVLGSICIIMVVVLLSVIMMSFFNIDSYIAASAEVRTEEAFSTLTVISGGEVNNIFYHDGDYVEKGNVILSLNSDELIENKKTLKNKIDENLDFLKNCELLVKSIQEDKNYFDVDSNPLFFYQYEEYRLSSEYSKATIKVKNDSVSNSKKAIDSAINSTKKNITNINKEISDYNELYKAIKNDTVTFSSSNSTVQSYFANYFTLFNSIKNSVDEFRQKYNELLSLKSSSPDEVNDNEIAKVANDLSTAEEQLNDLRVSSLLEISGYIQTLSSQGKTYENTVSNYVVQKNSLQYDNTGDLSVKMLKNNYFISIYENVDSIKKTNESIKTQIEEIDKRIENMDIVATNNGILFYNNEIAIGDIITSGSIIASILPNGSSLKATIFIPEKNIAEVDVGDKVEFVFDGISSRNYGKINGVVQRIAADSIYDASTQQKYYKVDASITNSCLMGKDGSVVNLKIGMLSEAHIITGEQSVINWVLEKLDFRLK